MVGTCRLCGNERELQDSHVVPRFVARWLREHSVNRRFRSTELPDLPHQDLLKRSLLCTDCEQLIGGFEHLTSERIFVPLQENRVARFRYGPWFHRFAVSVSWRALTVIREDQKLTNFPALKEVDSALSAWRSFLLGRTTIVAPYDQHVLPLDQACVHVDERARPLLDLALSTGAGIAFLPCPDGSAYVIGQLARMLVIGIIIDKHRREWKGTRLHAQGGAWGENHYDTPDAIRVWLLLQAKDLGDSVVNTSPEQLDRSKELFLRAVSRDPRVLEKSEMYRTLGPSSELLPHEEPPDTAKRKKEQT
jgi:hypothetical protein